MLRTPTIVCVELINVQTRDILSYSFWSNVFARNLTSVAFTMVDRIFSRLVSILEPTDLWTLNMPVFSERYPIQSFLGRYAPVGL